MNKRSIPAALTLMLVAAIAVFSQEKAVDYLGTWKLDLAKSEMGERSRVESMDMTVTQSVNHRPGFPDELVVEPKAKLSEASGGGTGRFDLFSARGKITYYLSGMAREATDAMGIRWVLQATVGMDGELNLKGTQKQSGLATYDERWSLSDDGKTLTVRISWVIMVDKFRQKLVFARQ